MTEKRWVDDAMLSQYRAQGFVVVEKFFQPEILRGVLEDAKEIFALQIGKRKSFEADVSLEEGMAELFRENRESFVGAARLCQHLISLHRLSLDAKILAVLNELGLRFPTICTRPVMYFSSPRLAASEIYYKMPPHQDWRTMQGSLDATVVWVPLVDVDKKLGALEILPGSHRAGLHESSPIDWNFFEVRDPASKNDFQPVELKAGDALFFSAFLVHRSGNNETNRIRWSVHFRYNNAAEKTFIDRAFPNPYLYQPKGDILFDDFSTSDELRRFREREWQE